MLGSVIVATDTYETLSAQSGITTILPTSALNGTMVVPQGIPLPALLFYMTFSAYGGPVNSVPAHHIGSETITLEVRALAEGTSDDPIVTVAEAALTALAGRITDRAYRGWMYQLCYTAMGEVPLTTLVEGDLIYRQLGATFSVDIMRGMQLPPED